MADIAPELYEKIKEIFDRKYAQAQILGESLGDIMGRINDGSATFRDADMFAVEVGAMMADAMKQVLVLEDLPGGQLYRNIAQRTIGEGLKDTYGIVSNISTTIQEEINAGNGIGLKAVKPKLETDRVDRIVNRASNAKTQAALENNLTDAVPTFARQVVDDTQKANARLHNKAGLKVTVEREYDGVGLHGGEDVCDWCLSRAGKFDYEKAMDVGAFERHEGCGCIITYTSAKGEVTIGTGAYLGGREGEGKTTTGWKWETEEDYKNRTKIKDPQELENKILNMEYLKPAKDIIGAKKSLEKETGLEVGGYYDTVNLDFANKANSEIVRAFEIFEDLHGQGVLDGVRILKNPNAEYVASYSPAMKEINFLQHNVRYKNALAKMREEASLQFQAGAWSTSSEMHAVRHELGHAVAHTLSDEKRAEIEALRQSLVERLGITVDIKNPPRLDMAMAGTELSYYGLKDVDEFIAESIAEYMDRGARNVAKSVVDIILRR